MSRFLFHPLAWLTDAALADSMLGDLEEVRRRHRSRGPLGAAVVFWRGALAILVHIAAVRLRDTMQTMVASGGGSNGIGGDVRHALTAMRRRPGFAVASILLLALGIGANTAVFSVVQGVMLRPLPYRQPDRLVFLWGSTNTGPGNTHSILTGQHIHELMRHQQTLESVAVFKRWDIGLDSQIDLLRPDGSERLRGAHVTPNFFELLGVTAQVGRAFQSSDDEAAPVAIISDALWKRRFGADPGVVGRQVVIAGGRQSRSNPAVTIVGVLPADFRFTYPRESEIYLLLPWSQIRPGGALLYGVVGRLRSPFTAAQTQAELLVVSRAVLLGYGFSPEQARIQLEKRAMMAESVENHLTAEVRPGLLLLAGVAALVLLIACVNLGLLAASRTIDRAGELAVRAALGAGPRRIVRLLLVEGCVLAALGGAAGVGLAMIAFPIVRSFIPPVVPRADQIGLDGSVLLFALAATTLAALVCGLVPGLLATRRDFLADVRRSAVSTTADRGVALVRMAVVGLQVAVVLVLLIGAGLLLRSFWRLQNVTLGFDAGDVLTFETRLLNPKYRQPGRTAAFEQDLLARVRQLPGVAAASVSTAVPMRGVDFLHVYGPPKGRPRPANARTVDPSYFDIMRIPLRQGRLLDERDVQGAPRVVVISEKYAHQLFGDVNPLGRHLESDAGNLEIVGVVGDVRYSQVQRAPAAAMYFPLAQQPVELVCLLVRPQPGMRVQVAAALRDVVRAIDPEQPIEGLTTIGEIVSESTADRRFYAAVIALFAAVALLLAIAGLSGVVSRSVTERRRELAIRVALGADARRMLRLVLAEGLLPVLLGCLAGLVCAMAVSQVAATLLFETTPTDESTYAAAILGIVVVAIVACLIPARRAVRVAPMLVLKGE